MASSMSVWFNMLVAKLPPHGDDRSELLSGRIAVHDPCRVELSGSTTETQSTAQIGACKT
jgi:hypothetical protein